MEIIEKVISFLKNRSFEKIQEIQEGTVFRNNMTVVIIDHKLRINEIYLSKSGEQPNIIPYHEYTYQQNRLMKEYNQVFRFLVETDEELEYFIGNFDNFMNNTTISDKITTSGTNRAISIVDPTVTEFYFERAIEQIYGFETVSSLEREVPYLDNNGSTRWIDYVIPYENKFIAIEQNGVRYHHPQLIGPKKYHSQLIKQNSLVSTGAKVFRWSLETMQFEDKFYEEIKFFLDEYIGKIRNKTITVERDFQLYDHQQISLEMIKEARKKGKKSFLLVFPTGTGKTRIVIEDYFSLLKNQPDLKLLFLVPTRALVTQTINVFEKEVKKRDLVIDINRGSNQILVYTYHKMSNNFRHFASDYFDYIVVDEAHHAVAPIISKYLAYFNPRYLFGVTATPDRLDGKRIEKIFGEYTSELTLEDAILTNVLVPIRAFRIKTNIDLSEVRYNGKDYVTSDLQKKILLPSRDQIVVDTLKEYLVNEDQPYRSGIIFCVSIKHAESFARRLNENGIISKAVSSKQKNNDLYIKEYSEGKIQFLTTASMLTEGWDSPRTSIIVMARPTMSKVLYLQQIGRGTRKYPGKEALYILDVVDNYGPLNAPWTIHAIFGIVKYIPMYNILETKGVYDDEIHTLDGLTETVVKYERINIGTFENKYPNHLSKEQLARELFVSTGTVSSWIKKKKLVADVTVPFGSKKLYFFDKNRLNDIRKDLNIKIHDENTIYEDFWEFISQKSYSMSYKMIFILSFMKIVDDHGEVDLDELTTEYIWFYKLLISRGLPVDRGNDPPYGRPGVINDIKYIQRSILTNPFEKYERKRFFYHSKDLKKLSISPYLLAKLELEDYKKRLFDIMIDDLQNYYGGNLPIDEIEEYYTK